MRVALQQGPGGTDNGDTADGLQRDGLAGRQPGQGGDNSETKSKKKVFRGSGLPKGIGAGPSDRKWQI